MYESRLSLYYLFFVFFSTYDHRTLKTRLPVRSALFKQRTGGLVVRWVTTSEYPLLYVFAFLLAAVSGDQKEKAMLFLADAMCEKVVVLYVR
jgi:hypothetical protein